MLEENHPTRDELNELLGELQKTLQSGSRTAEIDPVQMQIQQVLLRGRQSKVTPNTEDFANDDDPPFHMVGA